MSDLICGEHGSTASEVIAKINNNTTLINNNTTLINNNTTLINRISNQNLLINGGFDIWQRGESFTLKGYTSDRWKVSGVGTHGVTRVSSANPPFNNVYSNILRRSVSIGDNDPHVYQVMETANCFGLAGKEVTFSVDIRVSDIVQSMKLTLVTGTGVDEPFPVTGRVDFGMVIDKSELSTDFVRYSITAQMADDVSQILVLVRAQEIATIDWHFDLAQAKLEEGSVATPYRARPIGEELALCQRYYEVTSNGGLTSAFNHTSAYKMARIVFKVTKRKTPTSVIISASGGPFGAPTSSIGGFYSTLASSSTDTVHRYISSWSADAEL